MRIITFKGTYSYKEPEYSSGLICFVHFERNDTDEKIKEIVSTLIELAGSLNITIVPFSHLSANVMDQDKAHKLFNNLILKLKEKASKEISTAPFGIEKELHLDISADNGNVKFFHF